MKWKKLPYASGRFLQEDDYKELILESISKNVIKWKEVLDLCIEIDMCRVRHWRTKVFMIEAWNITTGGMTSNNNCKAWKQSQGWTEERDKWERG